LEKVIIYGNKAVARETYYGLKYYSNYEVVGFTVDRTYLEADRLFDLPIVPFDIVKNAFSPDKHKMFIAVGYVKNNNIRKDSYFLSKEMGYQLITYISPKSIVYPETPVGDNCLIDHYAVISPDAKIGNNVIICAGCTVGHDVVIDDHCFLSGDVSVGGGVRIGSCSFLGLRSIIRNKISIGNDCVIGAGALLLENAKDGSVYMGEPATLLPISSDKLPLG
jgi:sugar O-acyltransferase (sialic acid O-acetyltransferase NeuD family)